MNNTLFLFSILFTFPSFAFAEGSFCFRDSSQKLICKRSIDDIPSEYQRKAFFLSPENAPSKNPSLAPRINAPKHPTTHRSQISEALNQEDPRTSLKVTRDKPLSEKLVSKSTTKSIKSDDFPKTPMIETSDKNARTLKLPEENTPTLETHTLKINTNTSSPTDDSGLPPAKGYEPPPSLSAKPVHAPNMVAPPPERKTNSTELDSTKVYNKDATVEIYVADWCGHCKTLENFLISEKISYNKYDIEKDPKASSLYEIHGSVPISKIGNNIVVGFEAERYRAFLDATMPY